MFADVDGLWVSDEYSNESDSSSDENDCESDRTNAVDDGSCQHPVLFYLILILIFVTLLSFIENSSLQYVEDLFQQFLHRSVFR